MDIDAFEKYERNLNIQLNTQLSDLFLEFFVEIFG